MMFHGYIDIIPRAPCNVGPIPGNITIYHCTIVAVQVSLVTPGYRKDKEHCAFQVRLKIKEKTFQRQPIMFEDFLYHRNEMQRPGHLNHQLSTNNDIQLKSRGLSTAGQSHPGTCIFDNNRSPWIGTTVSNFGCVLKCCWICPV